MTTEQRAYITVNELLEIELHCKHPQCDVRFSWPLGQGQIFVGACPGCNREWFSGEDSRKKNLDMLIRALRGLSEHLPDAKFELRIRTESNAT